MRFAPFFMYRIYQVIASILAGDKFHTETKRERKADDRLRNARHQ